MKKIAMMAGAAAFSLGLAACGETEDATAVAPEAAVTADEAAPMGTASNEQGNNDQGNNDQGNNDQGNNDQGNNDQGNNDQGNNDQ